MHDLRTIINDCLDRLQEREKLNETALAQRLDVDPATLWRWRRGEVGKSAEILIPIIVANTMAPDPALH